MTKNLGCLEIVQLPEYGVQNVLAKIDTGAYSGAIHCTNIKVVRRGIKREKVLQFVPLGEKQFAQETKDFQKTFVRSATGHRVTRYLVDTTIQLGNQTYPIRIGLADRSEMKRSILIGRRFLRENNLIVDVRINQEYDDEGEMLI
jgi:hypothetical protein